MYLVAIESFRERYNFTSLFGRQGSWPLRQPASCTLHVILMGTFWLVLIMQTSISMLTPNKMDLIKHIGLWAPLASFDLVRWALAIAADKLQVWCR